MSRNALFALITIVVVIGVVVGIWYISQQPVKDTTTETTYSTESMDAADLQTLSAEDEPLQGGTMQSEDTIVGTGDEAVSGKSVTVHYIGTLTDGTKFDASVDRNQPFTFNLGAGEVIEGWDKGVVGMKVGGKRTLTIPSDMAYGNRATGSIPANSTLIFEVELLAVE